MIRHTVRKVSHSLISQAFPFYADPTVYFYGVGLYFDLPGDTGNFYISNLQLLSNPLAPTTSNSGSVNLLNLASIILPILAVSCLFSSSCLLLQGVILVIVLAVVIWKRCRDASCECCELDEARGRGKKPELIPLETKSSTKSLPILDPPQKNSNSRDYSSLSETNYASIPQMTVLSEKYSSYTGLIK